jgi:hypothetical protein
MYSPGSLNDAVVTALPCAIAGVADAKVTVPVPRY